MTKNYKIIDVLSSDFRHYDDDFWLKAIRNRNGKSKVLKIKDKLK